MKLIGTNTSTVIHDVKARMEEINRVLPPGIKVVTYYDQATLVAKLVHTVPKALIEAVVLTSIGGVLGILLGSAVGLGIHFASDFPISLPWWSFAIGIGFSASVGVFFGMFPAVKASRLDPIEALRYE